MAVAGDCIIAVAYFSIPVQILIAVSYYPRLTMVPTRLLCLFVLFALFIFCCGIGHVLRCFDHANGVVFRFINGMTAVISILTAVCLVPLVPSLMSSLDVNLADMQRLNEETLASKSKLKTFMAFLCHEIRNPLFAITSNLTFLSDEPLSSEQQRSVRAIGQATQLMLRLVNDVLDLNKLESGQIHVEERSFDLKSLLQHVAEQAQADAAKRHNGAVEFRFIMADSVPHVVKADSARILQIAYNLLSNASKFTKAGHIDFVASVEQNLPEGSDHNIEVDIGSHGPAHQRSRDEISMAALLDDAERGISGKSARNDMTDEIATLKIVVADTGAGISNERINAIFVPYSQGKLSNYRQHGGTGLGLAILAQLVEIMGGSIAVDSTEGVGTTFDVRIPVKLPAQIGSVVPEDLENMFKRSKNVSRLPDLFVDDELFDSGTEATSIQGTSSSTSRSTSSSSSSAVLASQASSSSSTAASYPIPASASKVLRKFTFAANSKVVLVTDDNTVNRKMLCRMLSNFNLEYKQAVNGLEAVDIILSSRNVTNNPDAPWFGLILMDLSMPIMGGCEATRILRRKRVKIPIIALTANALEETQEDALYAGATEFVAKPILRTDLYSKCQKYLFDDLSERDHDVEAEANQPCN